MIRLNPHLQRISVLIICFLVVASTGTTQEPGPVNVVDKLYRQVVKLHPLGVPDGEAKDAIYPLLSDRLVSAFTTRNACDQDWNRRHQNSDVPLKAPGVYEVGLFSGNVERGYIDGATVGRAKKQADHSFLVYVHLWSYFDEGEPSLRTGKVYRWQVAARVKQERGRFVIDDILGFKGVFDYDKPVFMSEMLQSGCRGTHSTSD
jgi:hypothetical protein